MRKFLRHLAAAVAVSACFGTAQAGPTVIDFEGGLDTTFAPLAPFVTHGDALIQGDFLIGTVSTKANPFESADPNHPGDLVGLLIDGADVGSTCFSVLCPSNNSTRFLGMVNDGLPWLGRVDGGLFRLNSFDAGFIAAAGVPVPSVPLLLRVYAWDIDDNLYYEDVLLSGATNGQLAFKNYTLSNAFTSRQYVEVDFYGYACNTAGSCNRTSNIAQFALDNISVFAVPEPASLILAGLAIAGLGATRRRRQAVAA